MVSANILLLIECRSLISSGDQPSAAFGEWRSKSNEVGIQDVSVNLITSEEC